MAGDLVYEVLRAVSAKRHEANVVGVRVSPEFRRKLDADAREAFAIDCPTGTCQINELRTIGGAAIYIDDTVDRYVVDTIPFA